MLRWNSINISGIFCDIFAVTSKFSKTAVVQSSIPIQVLTARPVLRCCSLAPYVPLTVLCSASVPELE